MRKILLSLLTATACSLPAMADVNTVVITSEGKSTNIALDDNPVVTVAESSLVVTTGSGLTLTYSTDNVVDFTLTSGSGIRDILAADATVPTFYFEGDVMNIYHLEPGSPVGLYGLDGTVYLQCRADAEGCLTVDLGRYTVHNGVVIVKTANKSIKISKK